MLQQRLHTICSHLCLHHTQLPGPATAPHWCLSCRMLHRNLWLQRPPSTITINLSGVLLQSVTWLQVCLQRNHWWDRISCPRTSRRSYLHALRQARVCCRATTNLRWGCENRCSLSCFSCAFMCSMCCMCFICEATTVCWLATLDPTLVGYSTGEAMCCMTLGDLS